MYTLLKQRRLRWLGHVSRVEDSRITKDLRYGELATRKRSTRRTQLRLKGICQRDLKALATNTDTWEAFVCDRCAWTQKVREGLSSCEDALTQLAEEKRAGRKSQPQTDKPAPTFCCTQCGRDCHSRIGLCSHCRRCSRLLHQRRYSIVPRDWRMSTISTSCLPF